MPHVDRRRQAAALVATAGLVGGAAGCSGAQVRKAGGSSAAKPLVLTLAAHDDDYAFGTFAAAAARLSHGSIRIKVAGSWGATRDRREIGYERAIVRDVRHGRVALGIVGVRVWDLLGVDSFQALLAPFLIDSLPLEREALASPLAARALASVDGHGVVGIALLPGLLRRPLGVTRPLLWPDDYRGATIGTRLGGVAEATFRALGATAVGYVPGVLPPHADGAELDPLTITENGYDHGARALTANVVFWPKPQTIVMNPKTFGRLGREQRRILREAGREAVAPELARLARQQALGLSLICRERELPLVSADAAGLAALRQAVLPVYAGLEHDPLTRRRIASILRMRAAGSATTDTLRCP